MGVSQYVCCHTASAYDGVYKTLTYRESSSLLLHSPSKMLSYFVALAATTLVSAWPATFYTDVNCTQVHSTYSNAPEGYCIDTKNVQSYRGSLESSGQELLLYGLSKECGLDYPVAVIPGDPLPCVFIYKHIGAFGAAEIMPVKPPHKDPHHKEPHRLVIQN